jgi:hypothetical protein
MKWIVKSSSGKCFHLILWLIRKLTYNFSYRLKKVQSKKKRDHPAPSLEEEDEKAAAPAGEDERSTNLLGSKDEDVIF